jgi:hypothetical protein
VSVYGKGKLAYTDKVYFSLPFPTHQPTTYRHLGCRFFLIITLCVSSRNNRHIKHIETHIDLATSVVMKYILYFVKGIKVIIDFGCCNFEIALVNK